MENSPGARVARCGPEARLRGDAVARRVGAEVAECGQGVGVAVPLRGGEGSGRSGGRQGGALPRLREAAAGGCAACRPQGGERRTLHRIRWATALRREPTPADERRTLWVCAWGECGEYIGCAVKAEWAMRRWARHAKSATWGCGTQIGPVFGRLRPAGRSECEPNETTWRDNERTRRGVFGGKPTSLASVLRPRR